MLKSYVVGWVIIVSAQVLLILTLGLWDFGLGLDNSNKMFRTQSAMSRVGTWYAGTVSAQGLVKDAPSAIAP